MKRPFGFNERRFQTIDQGIPGAGKYEAKSSFKLDQKPSAIFKTKIGVELDMVIGKDNPGIGEYDTQHHKTIANKEF